MQEMDRELLRANLEALLFVSEDPQSVTRLNDAIPEAEREEIREVLEEMGREYQEGAHGIHLVEIAGGYQICTKPVFATSINKLFERRRKRSLSKPALETLAIIAYKQPITRAEVEVLRGVNIDGALHTLLERRLVKIAGRKDVPGKPFLYRTTKSFLQYFGLKSLKELPKVEDVSQGLQPPEELLSREEEPELWDNVEEGSENEQKVAQEQQQNDSSVSEEDPGENKAE
jgi:segregation and condensation protein B